MLSTLRVSNLAVVDELEIEFTNGMNVMTGETGSGKSVILKAIELLAGKRGGADLIRHGEDRCVVEGVFHVSDLEQLRESLRADDESLADSLESDEVLVRRVFEKSGRGKIYVNGGLIGAAALQSLGEQLIDITGQHQQHTLLNASSHLNLLDLFGVSEKLRQEMRVAYEKFAQAKTRYQKFSEDSAQQELEIARYQFELQELDAAGLSLGGRAAAEAELHRLSHVEVLSSQIQKALAILEDDEQSIDERLRELLITLEKAASIDPHFQQVVQLVEAASAQLSESGLVLNQLGSRLEMNPERLEELRDQIAEIARLERKYGKKEDLLVGYRENIRTKLDALGGGELSLEKLKEEYESAEKIARSIAQKLSESRKKLSNELSQQVGKDLGLLNMKRAQFQVSLQPKELSATGQESVEFLFSANPGEPPRPLQKVASGGELSRVLLVLKTLLNEKNLPGTQVFDEIDSGISGAVSHVVGEKLLAVAKKSQVILVTHSPQIASLADTHFLIEKTASKNSTSTSIRMLDRKQRIEQLAGMLAGKEVSTHFEKSAEELLKNRERATS